MIQPHTQGVDIASGISPFALQLFGDHINVAALGAETGFEFVLTCVRLSLSLTAGLAVGGVFALRRRELWGAYTYHTWGYPVTPLLFIALSLWIFICSIVD